MVDQKRVAGVIEVRVNGDLLRAAGDFSYNPGQPKRDAMIGATGVDGYSEKPQVPFIEGDIRHTGRTNIMALCNITDATITLSLANGHGMVLRNGWYAGEGTGNTGEGTFGARFEGLSAEMLTS